jgi:hypothetical protein
MAPFGKYVSVRDKESRPSAILQTGGFMPLPPYHHHMFAGDLPARHVSLPLFQTGPHLAYDKKNCRRRFSMPYKLTMAMVLMLMLIPVNGESGGYHCDNRYEIIITPKDSDDAGMICTATVKALEFLSGYDLRPKRTIRFQVVDKSILSEGYDAFGSYDIHSEVINLMAYQAIFDSVKHPEMYGEPFDEVHYSGAIAHEVAHAVMHHNLMSKHISQAPQEYLAHATQLAVIPENRRNAIIKAMDVGPWESGDAISDIYMGIEPGKFAVKSYLHLTTMEQPKSFIGILLKSKWFYVYVP